MLRICSFSIVKVSQFIVKLVPIGEEKQLIMHRLMQQYMLLMLSFRHNGFFVSVADGLFKD
jgi:hypothetical protein